MTFIDLDEVILADHKVRLAGREYLLPGDLPVEQMLGLSHAWDQLSTREGEEHSGDELVRDLYDRALELFRVRQPDLESLPIGVVSIGRLIAGLYGGLDDEATPAADPPSAPERKAGPARGKTRHSPSKAPRKARQTA